MDLSEQFSSSESDSATDNQSDSDSLSQQGAAAPIQACRHYNQGNCRYGKKCRYLHVCQHFLQGRCRYGNSCRLRHITNSESGSSADESEGRRRRRGRRRRGRRQRSSSRDGEAGGGRSYRWQIKGENGWMDIANCHIIEAQYSRPNAKGIILYNTQFGAISIDFNKMKVLHKSQLRVRRLSSSQPGLETEWIWYFSGNRGWVQFGEKDSQGKVSSVQSSRIEREFQSNPNGSIQFTVDTTTYQISFREMRQENLSSGQKRKVSRRPQLKDAASSVTQALPRLSISTPTWQFQANSGKWYNFKYRRGTDTESSVSSADIEAQYQRNPRGSMSFTVSGREYTLNFSDMTEKNLTSQTIRSVRRIQQ
ncbi:hypothetical protein MATL_G00249480 [Megalops atlanticus]|uniref:Uncharacterized protein n=1 Tax=Megalops atlanticus TaxID=7932 RepID=A0A9D3PCS2_MEGAT|nr:hypothetical protein MATL_G00249480 [Megalops atlanticus]